MQHTYIGFAMNSWYIYVVAFLWKSFWSAHTVFYKFLDMSPMIKELLSGVKLTFEAILIVFHGHLVWHLGGILNGDCEMDIHRMFLIRYIGPLNSKRNSVSFFVTPLPSSLTFTYFPDPAWSTTQPYYSLNHTPGKKIGIILPRVVASASWQIHIQTRHADLVIQLLFAVVHFVIMSPLFLQCAETQYPMEGHFPLLLLHHHTASSSIRCVAHVALQILDPSFNSLGPSDAYMRR